MDAAVSDLLCYSEQMVYVARRSDISLCTDATLAADLAQVLVECAIADGGLTEEDSYLQGQGFLARAFSAQIQSQCVLYGLDLTKVEDARRAYDKRSRNDANAKRPLVYLRPLTTSKRIRVGNSFGPYYRRLIAAVGPLPADLSLEGALQIALSDKFEMEALGGPVDVFGMARGTVTSRHEASALDGWQSSILILIAVASVILVIFEDSAGLLWEMAEIARQEARSKVVFVVPPGRPGLAEPGASDSKLMHFRSVGFALPDDIHDYGFVLMNSRGAVETTLGFAALWDGELQRALSIKARSLR